MYGMVKGLNKQTQRPGLNVANLSVPSIDFLNKVETRLNESKYPYTKKDHSLIVNDPSGNQYQLILNS